jgi:Pyridoxamine 5'-phosphate oxidase
MSVLTPAQTRLLDEHDHGVIATLGRDGFPRQSVVYYARDGERLLVSTLANRAKTRRLKADEAWHPAVQTGAAAHSAGGRAVAGSNPVAPIKPDTAVERGVRAGAGSGHRCSQLELGTGLSTKREQVQNVYAGEN